jgi:hypothetical protein
MQLLSEQIDQFLVGLAWSLWTELGVAGIERHHQNCLISLEELILLTACIAKKDPRLRDEALDWCSRNHYFVSISRLKTLAKSLGKTVEEPFSLFAATLNATGQTKWPTFISAAPLKFISSGKSTPPRCELPALLSLRVRALFGVSARADLITYFLTQASPQFTASGLTLLGYSKRNLAEILDSLVQSGLFDAFMTRNQKCYQFLKRDQMLQLIGPLPKVILPWRDILELILLLRNCILQVEQKSEKIRIVEVRNTLMKIENTLRKLKLTPPPVQADFNAYWTAFSKWLLITLRNLCE